MKNTLFISTIIGLLLVSSAHAQQSSVTGKWETPDKDVIEFYSEGSSIMAKQVSTQTPKDEVNNNKVVATEIKSVSNLIFEGTVIDPKDNKHYKGRFVISNDGKTLQLKVKWGFLSFDETWKRLN